MKWRKLILWFGYALLVIGMLGWFPEVFIFVSGGPDKLNDFEFPLGELNGIAVDSKGNIYCGSQYYSRVQLYDSDGHFLRGWFIDSSGGSFKIKLDESDNLHIATVRNGIHYVFNTEGKMLKKINISKNYFDEISTNLEQFRAKDRRGNLYKAAPLSFIFPRVIKVNEAGTEKTLISTPIHKWIFMGPDPSWMLVIFGLLIKVALGKPRFLLKSKV